MENIKDVLTTEKRSYSIGSSSNEKFALTNPPIITSDICFGRNDDIKNTFDLLYKSKKIIIVNGIGGIGKTTMCKSIYKKVTDNPSQFLFNHIGWIDYKDNIIDSFLASFFLELIPQEYSRADKFRYLLEWINAHAENKNILLIIDNVDKMIKDDKDMNKVISLNCHIIVTSRFRILEKCVYSLDCLSLTSCTKLFLKYYEFKYAQKENEIIDTLPQIINLCGYHTMTIELLAKSSNIQRITLNAILKVLRESNFDLTQFTSKVTTNWDNMENEKSLGEHICKLFSIFSLSESEQELLFKLSLLACDKISIEKIKYILSEKQYDVLNTIANKGWITKDNDNIIMHRIIKFALNRINKKRKLNNYMYIVNNISSLLIWKESYLEVADLISHGEEVYNSFKGLNSYQLYELCTNISTYYLYYGNLQKSINYLHKASEILELIPEKKKELSECYKKIGAQYQELGMLEKAFEFHKKCLKIRKQLYPQVSFERSECYAHIGFYFQEKGKYNKALCNAKKAYNIRVKLYGKNSSITALSYNNLSLLYYYMYDFQKALKMINLSVKIREEEYRKCIKQSDKNKIDQKELDIAQSKSIRGLILEKLKCFEESYQDQECALQIREKRLNKKHIITGTSYSRMAMIMCYAKKNLLNKALEYSEIAIEIFEKNVGINSIDTGIAYQAKARVLYELKSYNASIEFYKKGMTQLKKAYGENHPRISLINEELGDVYSSMKNRDMAYVAYYDALNIRLKVIDSTHSSIKTLKQKIKFLEN